MRKVALTALAGTSIEWYDFFLYGAAAALIFPAAFFSENIPPATALILSLLTFAAGFIARPIGGIIFGHFGDKIGRKKTHPKRTAKMAHEARHFVDEASFGAYFF